MSSSAAAAEKDLDSASNSHGLKALKEATRGKGVRATILSSGIARVSSGMLGLAIIFLAMSKPGVTYASAAVLVSVLVLVSAACNPLWAWLADHIGQRQALRIIIPAETVALIALLFMVTGGAPYPVQIGLAAVVGAVGPSLGAFMRARWSDMPLQERKSLFSIEGSIDELVFAAGPGVVAALSLISPSAPLAVAICLFGSGGLLLIFWRRCRPTEPVPHRHQPPATEDDVEPRRFDRVLLLGAYATLSAIGVMFGLIEITVVAVFSPEGSSHGAMPDPLVGIVLGGWAITSLIGGVVLAHRLWARGAEARLSLLLSLNAVALAPAFLFASNTPVLVGSVLLSGFFNAALIASAFLVIAEHSSGRARTRNAAFGSSGISCGVAVGLGVGGAAALSFGSAAVLGLATGILAVLAVMNAVLGFLDSRV